MNVKLGSSRTSTIGIDRTRIAMYAGASGDFNPVHTDEAFATGAAGLPSVMAHGMLTMGLAGSLLSAWLGSRNITGFGVRFVLPVWPGDTLTTTARVVALHPSTDGDVADLEIETTNQNARVVLTGTAQARLAKPDGDQLVG